MSLISRTAPVGHTLLAADVADVVERACPSKAYRDKKVLLIVPDGTRTAPVGLLFRTIHQQIATARSLDILVALGTHQPMSEAAICERLEISSAERAQKYGHVRFFNHAWNDPGALTQVGILPAAEIDQLSGGLFSMDVPVAVNR